MGLKENIGKLRSKNKKGKGMPTLRRADIPIAVLCSDLHLSPNPPVARSIESNWYDVQAYYLSQVSDLCSEYNCPLVIAGDIFNKSVVSPECVHFAMKHFPDKTFAVPGQHDLPDHRYDDIQKSSFYTLVMSGHIKLLEFGIRTHIKGNWYAYGYPWGFDIIEDIDQYIPDERNLAVIHSYIWMGDNKYTGAPKEKNVNKWAQKLSYVGFNAAVFGDNHKGFSCMSEGEYDPWIINCGTFIRRNIDEINYKPMVGILRASGRIDPYYLDCSKDKFIEVGEALEVIEAALESTEFVKELSGLGRTLVNFYEAVERFCIKNNIDKKVMSIINKAMEANK